MKKTGKRITSVLLSVLMVLSMITTSFAAPAGGFESMAELSGAEAVSEVVAAEAAEEQAEEEAAPAEEAVPAEEQQEEMFGAAGNEETPVYIGFTSDVHGATTYLQNWFSALPQTVQLNNMCYCGDYSSSQKNDRDCYDDFINVVELTNTGLGAENNGVYTTGNHDYQAGEWLNEMKKTLGFFRLGKATNVSAEAPYIVYGFGAASNNGKGNFNTGDIKELSSFLQDNKAKPVFILSHYPLHYINDRTIENADKVIEVLNNYPNAVFMWGHNHSQNDGHYGEVKSFGDSITYTSSLSEEINFTYACAGAMNNDTGNYDGAVVKVDGTNLTFYYVDSSEGGAVKP